ncbi:MAG: hypothetical protein Q7S47_01970 [bacterium]|nr:hypothetical protein [bacterium]
MTIIKKMSALFIAGVCVLSLSSVASATTATTLALSQVSGDAVRVTISGITNSSIQLSFLPPGASVTTAIILGSTDGSGNFSTTLSSGGYAIPSGSPVFATINGVQSSTMLWPTYASSLSLSQTVVALAVGQSTTVTANNTLILAANSSTTIISTAISGGQITITGTNSGSGTISLCSQNVGCGSIAVQVGAQSGTSQVTFDQNNVVVRVKQSSSVTILSGSRNGYRITSNSNPTKLEATIGGTSSTISLYGSAAGTATVVVCSVESATNCANLNVTVLDTAVAALSFSTNNLVLIPGLSQTTTVSGGPSASYYISSNSNSGIAQATLSGTTITVVGGSNSGSTVVTVCSTSTNNVCGSLNVTVSTTTATPSTTVLVFSQNVVTVYQGSSSTVTVSGGNGTGYAISSNSNPSAVTASISGTSNVVALLGNTIGSAIVSVCSSSVGSTCASIYVTVNPAIQQLFINQSTISLSPGQSSIISLIGGSSSASIYSNSNQNVASATLNTGGSVIIVVGGTVSGTSLITVCPTSTYTTGCAVLTATNTTQATTPTTPVTISVGQLIKASTPIVYYLGTNGKRYAFPNERIFKTWYANFNSVITISDSALASYLIGGNVTYKPGSKMIKIVSSPKVYALDVRGTLRPIANETAASALYGSNWARLIEDVPTTFFADYSIGTAINSSADFNPSTAAAAASSISVDKHL